MQISYALHVIISELPNKITEKKAAQKVVSGTEE